MSESWLRFWDRPHSIYVNDRHLRVHYMRIADDILSILPPRSDLTVLDYGCGEALEAARVASRVRKLYLYDAASSVRDHVIRRFADNPTITVLDDAALAALPEGSVDVVIVFSVIQYIDRAALPALVASWRRVLSADGVLVIADTIPPDLGMVDDVRSLLRSAWTYGFLLAALRGLAMTLFSDYRRLRSQLGFSTYTEQQISTLLRDAGLRVERHSRNLGFHPGRHTYLARRA